MPKQFISTTELASLLGVSRITVFNRIKKGEIKAIKIGRNFIIDKADLPIELFNDGIDKNSEKIIQAAVKKTIAEYSETLRLLGKE
jgi:excisionase family DNA binding protein